MKQYNRVLSIAGSDSGGGAGIQADLKTFTALACFGTSVITALTAQNTQGVQAIHPVPTAFIQRQINSVLDDIGSDAIKIGMLHDTAVINTVAKAISSWQHVPIVLDPVMVATSGATLLQQDSIDALVTQLFPLATLITPNIIEAELLTNISIESEQDMLIAAKALREQGANNILIKGGHLESIDSAKDCLYTKNNETHWYDTKKINTENTHGTGCTLSSAIAAYLAKGDSLELACEHAKRYLTSAIKNGSMYKIGDGPGPVCHFYKNSYNNVV